MLRSFIAVLEGARGMTWRCWTRPTWAAPSASMRMVTCTWPAMLLDYICNAAVRGQGTEPCPGSGGNWHITQARALRRGGAHHSVQPPADVCRFQIGAPLVMGNTVVLKVPDQAPLSPLYMAELIKEVFPPGVINVISGDGRNTGDALVRHPRVKRIALTGSVETGLLIQRSAAEVMVKHVSLELGGKNPMIVFPDADMDSAVEGAARGMNFHWSQGQSCGSTSAPLPAP
jgi:betaine-aldehyde dehydrogenase